MENWSWREQLSLAGWEALSQVSGWKYAYQKARGLDKLRIHMQNERAKETKEFKLKIMRRDKWICYLDGKPIPYGEADLEHDIPLSRFGYTTEENCHAAHHRCNLAKGSKTAKEYLGKY